MFRFQYSNYYTTNCNLFAMKSCYIWGESLIENCDRLPAVPERASMVHSLIHSYGLLNQLKIVKASQATYDELKECHSERYLDHLKTFIEVDDEYMSDTQDEEYGIGYDCPPVSNMFELVSTIAGSTVTAAKCLLLGEADIAINWCGGWHHAQRSGAEGFCYVNDIVVGIAKLRKKFPKVLYIDLDVHHGNGVQNSFSLDSSVFTLSFHKFEPGFFPGTGGLEDIGRLAGKGYSCNFPFRAGYSDDTMENAFGKVFNSVYTHFAPDAIVVQCGADALAHDPNGGGRLSIHGYCACVTTVFGKKKPTMLLGGGGYNHANTARLWASLTALVTGTELDENIPEHSYWTKYGPDYMLSIQPTLAKDMNTQSYIDMCIKTIEGNLEKYLPVSYGAQPKRLKTENGISANCDKDLKEKQVVDVYEFVD